MSSRNLQRQIWRRLRVPFQQPWMDSGSFQIEVPSGKLKKYQKNRMYEQKLTRDSILRVDENALSNIQLYILIAIGYDAG